jgi:hypothetical protein
VVAGGVTWLVLALRKPPVPACTAGGYSLTPDQAQNAATIAGVGSRLGMPAHAVTVALATALQESKLRNLTGGDRDSAGLFQQRPSQGWGTYEQVTDPVYASTAFYLRLRAQPDWTELTVTQAAQLVQHSGAPEAYAQWEPEARAFAGAMTGQTVATFTCHDLVLSTSAANLVTVANAELGTAVFTGPHDAARGWALAAYLVANATRFAVDRVTYDGQTWTAAGGTWSITGATDGRLTLHQVSGSG